MRLRRLWWPLLATKQGILETSMAVCQEDIRRCDVPLRRFRCLGPSSAIRAGGVDSGSKAYGLEVGVRCKLWGSGV